MAKDKDEFYESGVSESATDSSKRSVMMANSDNSVLGADIVLTPPTMLAYNGETYYIAPPSPITHHNDGRSPKGRDQHVVADKHRPDLGELSIASEELHPQRNDDATRRGGMCVCDCRPTCQVV